MRSRYLLSALLVVPALIGFFSIPSPAEEGVSAERINQLIEQMGSGTFAEREKATKELDTIGAPALEALRKAAKSEDAEVRKRAEELVKKIEKQAESAKILAPKRVHLVYNETPVNEAVTDFQKKSGYSLYLHDPDGKLKERTITLDTGETTFWHAFDLFCAKAGLTEPTLQDVMVAPPPGAAGAAAPPVRPLGLKQPIPPQGPKLPAAPLGGARAVRRFMPGTPGQILLKDGKPRKLPTDDRSAVRVRALPKAEAFGPIPESEILLALDGMPEPKLQWQGFQSVRIERAVDDRDQKLTQVTPQVPVPAGPGGFALPGGPGAPMRPAAAPVPGFWLGAPGPQVPIQLKKAEKAARSLKELTGVLTANVLSEATPMITADNLAKAAGKTFKGDEGGSIKIIEVKTDEKKKTTIQLEFEQPPNTFAAMEAVPAMPPVGVRVQPAPAVPAPPPPPPPPPAAQAPGGNGAAAQLQVQVKGQGGGVVIMGGAAPVFMGPLNGLSVQDDKGNALAVQMGPQQFRMIGQPGGGNGFVATYTLYCTPGKDQGAPAKVVYLGRKRVTVDIPFALKDVPLP